MLLAGSASLSAQAPAAQKPTPNLMDNIDRPLRYRPDGEDFVIENGAEFFNRPLYGGNTAFRVDGGDKPEFVLYLPGRGGNLRFGIKSAAGARWLQEAAQITTRYRPGELLYEIRDPLLGAKGVVRLAVVAWHQAEGLGARVEAEGVGPGVELVWAYGGVNGERGARDGDIGTEKVPISEWFQLQPDFCRKNSVELADGAFTLRASLPREQSAIIAGVGPAGARLTVGDAGQWNDLPTLLSAAFIRAPDLPVVVGRVPLGNVTPLYLSFQRLASDVVAPDLDTYQEAGAKVERVAPQRASSAAVQTSALGSNALHLADLPAAFAATEAHFAELRNRVKVETPDPYLNAAVGALNVAADAVWDEPQQAIMHGAIAWRTKLLGWRGPYSLDALGWPERARKHFEYWATRQNTDPIPEKLPPPDEKSNLARSEAALHSNGDISNSHYDMNLVFIDALFRHLLWTGDAEFAKRMWPVVERHLAWERRLFRREFTVDGEKLPLYEAYAAIWASDDLQYSGGGTAYASAYNYWHNKMAARIASLVGVDPAPYEREAEQIVDGMQQLLWVGDHYAECKDLLGRQLVHSSEGLWSFYHVADAGLPGLETMAGRLAQRPRIPIRGSDVPADEDYGVLPTTNWLPYTWSLNNVVMSENIHTALGLWLGHESEAACRLLKSALLASMFMGISPGNVGSMNYLDVYRRESQRDFADGSGVLSRAIVEGLFGLKPNAFEGILQIQPGFPEKWDHARLTHPAISLSFRREGRFDVYEVGAASGQFNRLALHLHARTEECRIVIEGPGLSRPYRISAKVLAGFMPVFLRWKEPRKITVEWVGLVVPPPATAANTRPAHPPSAPAEWSRSTGPNGPVLETVPMDAYFNDQVTGIFQPGKYLSPRSAFVSLALPSQGIGYWAGHINANAEIDDRGLRAASAANAGRFVLPNGVPFATPGPGDGKNILFTSQWDNYPRVAAVSLGGRAHRLHLLMAGSTNAMQSRLDNGEVIVSYTDGTTSRLALRNPETWWPIEQDYFLDDYQFRVDGPLPTRVNLKTGQVRVLDAATFKGQGGVVPGGAATVLELALDPTKELKSLTVRALANDVVIGLMAATLER